MSEALIGTLDSKTGSSTVALAVLREISRLPPAESDIEPTGIHFARAIVRVPVSRLDAIPAAVDEIAAALMAINFTRYIRLPNVPGGITHDCHGAEHQLLRIIGQYFIQTDTYGWSLEVAVA